MEKISKTIIYGIVLAVFPCIVSAATLSLSPSSKNIKPGSVFTVTIVANTEDREMHAVSGTISFDPAMLEATGISKTDSIISEWDKGPTRSNANGTISFEGIAAAAGYNGSNGKILTASFRARRVGDTKLNFTSGSILANDGTGSDILKSMVPLSLSFVDDQTKSTMSDTSATSSSASDNGIVIKSSSHPDSTKWYSNNTPELTWTLPENTTEIKTLINKSESRDPNVSYIPAVYEKTLDSLADGKYFFSIKAKTSKGWTSVSRKAINIDTVPPQSFSVTIADETRDRHLPPALLFSTTDSISDTLKYEVRVGNGDVINTGEHKNGDPYIIPAQNPGAYVVTVSAYDEAGNVRTETAGFIIEAIATPKIVTFPSEVTTGSKEEIKGITYPNATVSFYYHDGEKIVIEETTKSTDKGDFRMPVTGKLQSGVYILTIRTTDQNGARSNETSPIIISFKPLYATFSFILYIFIIFIVFISVFLAIYMWKKSDRIGKINKTRVRQLTRDAQHITEKSFEILREEIGGRVTILKAMKPKRKFIDDEAAFLEEIEASLLEARVVIIEDIQKISDIGSH